MRLYQLNGRPIEVSEEDAEQLLASGKLRTDEKEVYNFVDSEGTTVGSLPGNRAAEALKRGYRFERASEREVRVARAKMKSGEDVGATSKAVLAGAARGATVGLSDLVLTKSGLVDPEYLEALRQEKGGASLGGELAGTALGLVASGGSSGLLKTAAHMERAGLSSKSAFGIADALLPSAGVSKIGSIVSNRVEGLALRALSGGEKAIEGAGLSLSKRALARAGAFTAAGAVEGSLVGIGQAITEEALGDPRDMGELLVAGIGPGAAIGGLAGGLFGAGSALGGSALSKMARRAESGFAKAVGEEVPQARRDQVFEAMGLKSQQFKKLGTERVNKATDYLLDPNLLGDGMPLINVKQTTAHNVERMKEAVQKYGSKVGETISGLDDIAAKAAASGDDITQEMPNKELLINKLEELKVDWSRSKAANKAGIKQLTSIQQELAEDGSLMGSFRDLQYKKAAYRNRGRFAVGADVAPGSAKDAFNKAEGFLAEELEDAADRWFSKLNEQERYVDYLHAKDVYKHLVEISSAAGEAWESAAHSYTDDIVKAGKEFFKSLAWRMIYSGRGSASAAKSAMTAMGLRKAGDTLAEGQSVVMDYVQPSRITRYATDAAKLASIQKNAKTFADKVDLVVDKALSSKVNRVTAQPSVRILNDLTGVKDEQGAWKAYREQLHALSDPNKLTSQIAMTFGGLEEVAPNISFEAAATAARACGVVKEAMPKPFNAMTLQPDLSGDYDVTPDEMSTFKRVVAAAMRPESVVEDLQQGTLTPEAVQTLSYVYPRFYEMLKSSIAQKVAERPETIPYNLRAQLAVLFDLPTDPTLAQDFIQRSQLAWAPTGPTPNPQGSPPKLDPDAARKLSNSQAFKTSSQQVEDGLGA